MSHISRLANLKNNNNKIKKQGKGNEEKEKGASLSPGHQVPEKQQIGLSFLKVA